MSSSLRPSTSLRISLVVLAVLGGGPAWLAGGVRVDITRSFDDRLTEQGVGHAAEVIAVGELWVVGRVLGR